MQLRSGTAVFWCRLVPTAPIGPLAWELPYAEDATLKRQKINKIKCLKVNVDGANNIVGRCLFNLG